MSSKSSFLLPFLPFKLPFRCNLLTNTKSMSKFFTLSLIHIWRCRRYSLLVTSYRFKSDSVKCHPNLRSYFHFYLSNFLFSATYLLTQNQFRKQSFFYCSSTLHPQIIGLDAFEVDLVVPSRQIRKLGIMRSFVRYAGGVQKSQHASHFSWADAPGVQYVPVVIKSKSDCFWRPPAE